MVSLSKDREHLGTGGPVIVEVQCANSMGVHSF